MKFKQSLLGGSSFPPKIYSNKLHLSQLFLGFIPVEYFNLINNYQFHCITHYYLTPNPHPTNLRPTHQHTLRHQNVLYALSLLFKTQGLKQTKTYRIEFINFSFNPMSSFSKKEIKETSQCILCISLSALFT